MLLVQLLILLRLTNALQTHIHWHIRRARAPPAAQVSCLLPSCPRQLIPQPCPYLPPPAGDPYSAQLCQAKLHQKAALQAASLAERHAAYLLAADMYLGLVQPGHAKAGEHCKAAAKCLIHANEYQRAAQVYSRQCQPPEHETAAECYEKVGLGGMVWCGCVWGKRGGENGLVRLQHGLVGAIGVWWCTGACFWHCTGTRRHPATRGYTFHESQVHHTAMMPVVLSSSKYPCGRTV